jgi:C-methyltransferase C-terminal domain/Putative zinc binding domain/Methyltransferase domain
MSDAITSCRSCGTTDLEPILSLGSTPLANSLPASDAPEGGAEVYPLDVVFCPTCTLVQITETVPPEVLFRDYLYFSSFSDTMVRHAQDLVQEVLDERHLGPDSLAAEVASNDGYLLQFYKRAGVPVLGIEPARNIARVASEERGIRTLPEFFGNDLARELATRGERADVLHANNVLAHVADLNGFVAGVRHFLKETGVAVIEAPYVKDLVEHCEFDTIYHEHLCYFSLTALERLFRRHELQITGASRVAIHGGSLRLRVQHAGAAEPDEGMRRLLQEEQAWGVGDVELYRAFATRVERLKSELRELLADIKGRGASVAAYGAAAKGSTLLNYFHIGRETIDFVADRSTYKQGRYMPGVRIPIVEPARILQEMPDYLLLLTWNFAEEILEQQAEYRSRGGRFIIPVPELRVV